MVKYPGLWRRIMEALGAKTQREVAQKLGLSDASMTNWKQRGFISIDSLLSISELSDVSIHWLITGQGPRHLHPEFRRDTGQSLAHNREEDFLPVYLEEHLEEKINDLAKSEGRRPSDEAAKLIVEALIARGAISDKLEGAMHLEFFGDYNPKLMPIPLLGEIAAGQPIHVFEETESIEVAEDFIARGRRTFALRVRGDSMTEEGILDRDIIICAESSMANPGDTVVALIDGQEATVKRFYKKAGQVVLRPANPLYKDIVVDASRVVIRGIVIGIQRRT